MGDRPGVAGHRRRLEPVRRPAGTGAGAVRVFTRGPGLGGTGRAGPARRPGGRRRPPLSELELRCRGWRQEAILRLLENNLAIAEDPEHLVVYAAHAKAARDHDSLRGIVDA